MIYAPKNPERKFFIVMMLILAATIVLTMFGCKKETHEPEKKQVITLEQDQNLFGSWSQDSSIMDGSVMAYSTDPDSAYITSALFKRVWYWNYGTPYESKTTSEESWVTSGDSLFLNTNGVEGNHYWYSVNGNLLTLYLNSKYSNDVKYFYHR